VLAWFFAGMVHCPSSAGAADLGGIGACPEAQPIENQTMSSDANQNAG
jgi:hypothetical protein